MGGSIGNFFDGLRQNDPLDTAVHNAVFPTTPGMPAPGPAPGGAGKMPVAGQPGSAVMPAANNPASWMQNGQQITLAPPGAGGGVNWTPPGMSTTGPPVAANYNAYGAGNRGAPTPQQLAAGIRQTTTPTNGKVATAGHMTMVNGKPVAAGQSLGI